MKLSHQDYYKIAIPFIVSTVTQPLLGAVDTAVIGQLGNAALIAGVAIGTVLMNTLYWLFGFFRVSTTGQSAMALGQGCRQAQAASLMRPIQLAAFIGLLFILLQNPLWQAAMFVLQPEQEVAQEAYRYFSILIYGAPFVLVNYSLIGWLMGQAKAKETLYTQVFGNLLNIVLNLLLVFQFDMGIAGVAYASLIAQIATFVIGCWLVVHTTDVSMPDFLACGRLKRQDLMLIISANTDLLLRTVCILIFFNMMARIGAQLGTDVLAANAIMMQVTFIISYLFDGIANASSVFAGRAVGEKNPELLQQVLKMNAQWTAVFVAVLTLFTATFSDQLVRLFTDLPALLTLYQQHSLWLVIFPLAAGFGLTLYGVFTGTGTTRPVRNSSIATLIVFLLVQWPAVAYWGNQGLWLAFTLFYCGRFGFLYPFVNQIKQRCQPASPSTL